MRFLSTRRRHRAAKPLALLVALFLMGGLYAALMPSAQSSADPTTDPNVAAGKQLFTTNCSSCHGLNGEGTTQGPTLIGVGAAAVDFQVMTGRMPMARPEAQAPAKPVQLTQQQSDQLAAYIASLGQGPAIPQPSQYTNGQLTPQQIARGGELFRTNCSACHNFEGKGGALPNGAYAPDLTKTSSKHIYEAIRTGPQQMPVFSKGVLTDQDVTEIIAYLNTLHSQPDHGGFSLGGIGPVSEGFWGWIVGIGACVFVAHWLARKGARAR